MTSELSFLLDLLLNQKLLSPVKKIVVERIKEVEAALSAVPPIPSPPPPRIRPLNGVIQAASTQALLDRDGPLPTSPMPPAPAAMQPQAIPTQTAFTPAAQAALEARRALIGQAVSGATERGRTQPRKC